MKPHSQKSAKRPSVLYKGHGAEMASLVALGPKSPAVWAKSRSAQQAKLQPSGRLLPSASFHALGLLPLPVWEDAHSHRADTRVLVILQLNDVTSVPDSHQIL